MKNLIGSLLIGLGMAALIFSSHAGWNDVLGMVVFMGGLELVISDRIQNLEEKMTKKFKDIVELG